VRLPNGLKIRSKELYIEQGRNGDLVLFDPKVRERAWQKRRKALHELLKSPPLEVGDKLERF